MLAFSVSCLMAGCSTAPTTRTAAVVPTNADVVVRRDTSTNLPQASSAEVASLRPGATYIASFSEAERRAACVRLEYREGTAAFAACLEGNFPENPYLAR